MLPTFISIHEMNVYAYQLSGCCGEVDLLICPVPPCYSSCGDRANLPSHVTSVAMPGTTLSDTCRSPLPTPTVPAMRDAPPAACSTNATMVPSVMLVEFPGFGGQ